MLGSAKVAGAGTETNEKPTTSMLMGVVEEIIYSPLNLALVVIIGFLVYKIVRDRFEVPKYKSGDGQPQVPELKKLRRDFTIQELRAFDGTQPDGRILIAINGIVYDVTKQKRFYGPGGPYASFAGRDASRNLATFSVEPNNKEEYDDLSDLSAMEMDSVREWEMQFKEKYDVVGKLLRKGEQPTNYEDEDEDENTVDTAKTNEVAATTTSAAPATAPAAACAATADEESIRKRATNSSAEEVK